MKYGAYVQRKFCCGHVEVGSFRTNADSNYWGGNTPQDFITAVTNAVSPGILLSIWFYKNRVSFDGKEGEAPNDSNTTWEDDYHWEEVRQAVKEIPGVLHLGEHINPNSGNKIDGYMWKAQ